MSIGSIARLAVEVGGTGHYMYSSTSEAIGIQKYAGSQHSGSAGMENIANFGVSEAAFLGGMMVGGPVLGIGLSIAASVGLGTFMEEANLAKARYADPGTSSQFGRGAFQDSRGAQKSRARHMAMMANGDPNLAASKMANFAILGQEASYMHY